ncbi:DUF397 domain-containing protein [Actinoallomurus sp. CA-150999]
MDDVSDLEWRKSTRSNDTGGMCVEVAEWRTSRRSDDTGGMCVEVAVATS